MVKTNGNRSHFVHRRNVKKDEPGNCFEAGDPDGEVDIDAVMKKLLVSSGQ